MCVYVCTCAKDSDFYKLPALSIVYPDLDTIRPPEGASLENIRCEHSGGATLAWYKDGTELQADGVHIIIVNTVQGGISDSLLTVNDITAADAGDYKCQNVADPSESATLTVVIPGKMNTLSQLSLICEIECKTKHVC